MKKRAGLWGIIVLVLAVSFIIEIQTGAAQAKNSAKLYRNFDVITDEESISFVKLHNIEIPESLLKSKDFGSVTASIIKSIYDNPEVVFAFNYKKMQEYAESIRKIITENYVRKESKNSDPKEQYKLQYNTVRDANGNWVNSGGYYDIRWLNYNCYAFSIHRIEQPAFYYTEGQYQPGDLAEDESGPGAINTYEDCNSIEDLASLVRKDLIAMGYSNIVISDYPLSVSSSQELICVREQRKIDFHFMHYDKSSGKWYHKPGNTAVLRYEGAMDNSKEWKCEYSFRGKEGYNPTKKYDSNIKYIRYDKNKVVLSSGASSVSYSLQVKKGKDALLEIDNTGSRLYKFVLSASSSVTAKLYDSEMELINTYSGTGITFCNTLGSGTYYLAISYENSNSYGNVSINISSHSHNYGAPYVWKNYTKHNAKCDCGTISARPHVVPANSYVPGQQYATCLLCGGLASIGITNRGLSVESLPHTANGSFKLPNGVVILVDDDMDAFLDDTLVFIESDDSVLKN